MNNEQVASTITDRQRKYEIAAVVLTGVGKFIFMDFLQWKLIFIAVAIISWTMYVFYQHKRIPGVLTYWGFTTGNFRAVLRIVLPFGIVAVICFLIIGSYLKTINLTWHIIPILILYPVWGIIQQFLVISLVAGNLKDLQRYKIREVAIIVLTALLFGLLHYPFYWLIVGTFLLALFYGFVFMRVRNVLVMGIFHGWLGALFFYTVVGRDPFAEVFLKFQQF